MIGNRPQAPDFIEPIAAYRCWRYGVDERGVSLCPLNQAGSNEWDGSWRGWVLASCRLPGKTHVAPDEGCSCGFYALKSLDDAAFMFSTEWPRTGPLEPNGVVLGRVELAGKVIEHDDGYRAERARVAELIPTTADGGLARWLAAFLDLPVGPDVNTAVLDEELAVLRRGIPPGVGSGHLYRVLLTLHWNRLRSLQGVRKRRPRT